MIGLLRLRADPWCQSLGLVKKILICFAFFIFFGWVDEYDSTQCFLRKLCVEGIRIREFNEEIVGLLSSVDGEKIEFWEEKKKHESKLAISETFKLPLVADNDFNFIAL